MKHNFVSKYVQLNSMLIYYYYYYYYFYLLLLLFLWGVIL